MCGVCVCGACVFGGEVYPPPPKIRGDGETGYFTPPSVDRNVPNDRRSSVGWVRSSHLCINIIIPLPWLRLAVAPPIATNRHPSGLNSNLIVVSLTPPPYTNVPSAGSRPVAGTPRPTPPQTTFSPINDLICHDRRSMFYNYIKHVPATPT